MKRNRIIALICSVALTATIFVGCGNKAKVDDKAKSTAPAGPVTLKVQVWGSSPTETKLIDEQIAAFNVANKSKKITLKKEVAVGDYNQVMQTKIAAKTEADLFYLDVSLAPSFIDKGVVAPLDEYLDKEDLKDFYPNLLEGFQKDGKTYGLPKDFNSLGLFYNKKMFADAGITTPPKTWAEFEEVSKKLSKGKVKALSLPDDSARFAPFIFQAGGNIVDGDKMAFNTPEAAKGLEFYYSMIKKGYAATPKDLGDGWPGDSLAKGNAAMVVEGGWMIPFMKETAPKVEYGIAELPKGQKQGNMLFTVSYSMSTNTKHPKEAAEAIKFLTGKTSQEMVANSGLAIPTRTSMGSVYTDKFPERKALVDGTKYATPYSYGLKFAKINLELGKAGERLRLGKNPDAKTALDEAFKAVQ
ncbi:ABC transporter substrate-binding protein [Clostridium bowmanii]|uniref:ABC transporter substrate-binding protein n=1 Tax=Clostridium bowmanii TaxID=132925 RepID=UPI001C0E5810|nr:ABC transporter substrate-binding protein [Clostridium bowmanii]MBU3188033.1 ABC transporter substrate-binding protein [Clostridium bowmanii]MCA1072212.1 ABC transporter substrate-binding protein [Clostridium bowmanii]